MLTPTVPVAYEWPEFDGTENKNVAYTLMEKSDATGIVTVPVCEKCGCYHLAGEKDVLYAVKSSLDSIYAEQMKKNADSFIVTEPECVYTVMPDGSVAMALNIKVRWNDSGEQKGAALRYMIH